MSRIKRWVQRIPGARSFYVWYSKRKFSSSQDYWQSRYAKGGNSGAGSYGRLAEFKAEVLNGLVAEHRIESVVEFGCGDGNQLTLADYPRYLGLDVSPQAVAACSERFQGDPTRQFLLYKPASFGDIDGDDSAHRAAADLALSLDVIYHLVEDEVFDLYMTHLFQVAQRMVVIYSSNQEGGVTAAHLRHRRFTDWISEHARQWTLKSKIENRYPFDPNRPDETSFADFYVFEKTLDS